jgi:DNA-binding MarR family transcriptional regulator
MTTDSTIRDCADCLCMASRQAARAITGIFDRHLRPYQVRVTQFSILANLLLRGPTMLGELARALTLERTSLTRNLALMEKHGWVEIQPDAADSRARIVSATKAGRALVHAAYPGWRDAQDEVASLIGEQGSAALHGLANAMTE